MARDPVPMRPDQDLRVAFLITIVLGKEPLEVMRTTLAAAREIHYEGRFDVWLLDEGDNADVREMCSQAGARHFSRAELPGALCVAGAVVLLSEPFDAGGSVVFASDGQAGWIGDCQRRAAQGPLIAAVRSGRPMLTPDIARIDPHEAEHGFVSSMTAPLETVGGRLGGLQLFGDFWRPVESRHADLIGPLVEVLVERLLDVVTIRTLTDVVPNAASWPVEAPLPATAAEPVDVVTLALPVSVPADAVPLPRRSRHSRSRSAQR